MTNLSEDELREFIDDFEGLFNSLTDIKLLEKTTKILKELVVKMETENKFFSKEEIAAIKIGIGILENGYHLFDNMSDAEKKEMVSLIMKAEHQFVIDLRKKYN